MAIQYAGGTIINTTISAPDRPTLVTNLITQLVAAGWSNVSGSGTDQVLKCASTTIGLTGLQIAVRIYDPGSGNCARVALRNVTGTRIGGDHWLLPAAGKVYRVIANKYQFACFTPGGSLAREFVYAGQLIVPTWLTGLSTNSSIACSNGTSDTSTGSVSSFRTLITCTSNGRSTALSNDTLLDINNAVVIGAYPRLAAMVADQSSAGYRWFDNTLVEYDAIVYAGTASNADEGKARGQMSDAMVIADAFPADTNISFDGRTWWAITDNNIGGTNQPLRGTLFLAVT